MPTQEAIAYCLTVQAIEFVASVKSIYKGVGGYNEDNEYFGELANI